MLSGIGAPDALKQNRINIVSDVPGVGKNLRDHTSAAMSFKRKTRSQFLDEMRLDRVAFSLTRAYLGGGGFAADLPFGITAFLKTRPEEPVPDVQMLYWFGATQAAAPYLPPFKKPFADTFSCRVMPMRPDSAGHVELASNDPATPVRIHQAFLTNQSEWRVMRRGLRMIREIAAQKPLAPFVGEEVAPGPSCNTDAALDEHVRRTMITVHHPVGTCKMGPASDPHAVVDAELKVRGVDRLRVVDASVFPDLIAGATNAPVIMIAEKTADMIRGRDQLPAARV
jgi:4-pyridoxate dehydrogenase